jgi:glyoxylase-like metal-dependent hydrolase (beta-lactamase superfamily II)
VYGGAGAEVIASQRTKENLTRPDAGVGGIPFVEKQIAGLPKEIDDLKAAIQKASDPKTKATLESNLQQAEVFLQELKSLKPTLPTRTITAMTKLNEQGREIQLHLLGRAHTDGDLFTYLPKEKVVMTGDAVIDWMPFMNDGYPDEWVGTIDALAKLDFTHIIMGHGDVATKNHLTFFRGYFVDLLDAVKKASAAGASLDDMKRDVGNQLAAKYEAGFSKYPLGRYRDRVGTNIEAVYRKVVKKG